MKRKFATSIAACVAASTLLVVAPSFAQTAANGTGGDAQNYSQNHDAGRHWGWLGLLGLVGLAGLRRKDGDDYRNMSGRSV